MRTEARLSAQLQILHEVSLELSTAPSVDDLCRRAVELGTRQLGFDRLGIWFFDPDNPQQMLGSFGVDENGAVRDERAIRVSRDEQVFPAEFLTNKKPLLRRERVPVYGTKHNQVGVADCLVAPLWTGKQTIGQMSVDNLLSGKPFDSVDADIIVLLARTLGYLCTLKRTEEQLRESQERLEQLAATDGLTGALNRRTGVALLDQQMRQVRRKPFPLSIGYIDVDGLKEVNDNFGHTAGDRLLQVVVESIRATIRESDSVCRLGGDEFLVILPDSDSENSSQIMNRLCAETEERARRAGLPGAAAFSYGVASLPADNVDDPDQFIAWADRRMYEQKHRRHSRRRTGTPPEAACDEE